MCWFCGSQGLKIHENPYIPSRSVDFEDLKIRFTSLLSALDWQRALAFANRLPENIVTWSLLEKAFQRLLSSASGARSHAFPCIFELFLAFLGR